MLTDAALQSRKLFVQLIGELVHVRVFAESLNFLRGGFHIDAQMPAQLLQHLESGGEFLLGEHAHLKVEVRPFSA